FTGEALTAVRALRPDVGIVHAQRADRQGNVQIWGIVGVQKEIVLASSRSLVTVEEIVDELEPRPGAIVLPTWAVGAVAEAPRGAGGDGGRRRPGSGNLRLLAPGRADRRGLPRCGADRPARQSEQHRDRGLRAPEGPAARRRGRARDRGDGEGGDRDAAAVAP